MEIGWVTVLEYMYNKWACVSVGFRKRGDALFYYKGIYKGERLGFLDEKQNITLFYEWTGTKWVKVKDRKQIRLRK